MSDWIDDLTPDERSDWDAFVDHFRRDTLEKIAGSGTFVSIVPSGQDAVDVKFAVELGAAIMLDKPILAIAAPGAWVPAKLKDIADEIVRADIDTAEGREIVAEAIARRVA